MQTLFPIIRRVRRPLLVRDTPPVVVGNVEPVRAEARDEHGGNLPGEIEVQTNGPERSPGHSPDCISSTANPTPVPTIPE